MLKYILLFLLFGNVVYGVRIKEWAKDPSKYVTKNVVINSFDDCYEAFEPILKYNYAFEIISSPHKIIGKLFGYRFEIIQIVGNRKFLLGADTGYGSMKYFIAKVDNRFKGNTTFFDNQIVNIIGNIRGSERYETVNGSIKTVPLIAVYAIK